MKKFATCLGLAIGDALGQPFEFSTMEQIQATGWNSNFASGIISGNRKTESIQMILLWQNVLLSH